MSIPSYDWTHRSPIIKVDYDGFTLKQSYLRMRYYVWDSNDDHQLRCGTSDSPISDRLPLWLVMM